MAFVIFLLLVYGLCLFHRFEHRVMIKDLARLVPFLPLQNGIPARHDWRQVGGNAETPVLKRAFHIYGKDILAAKERLFDRLETTAFEDRVYEFNDEMIREMYDEAEAGVLRKIEAYDNEHRRN